MEPNGYHSEQRTRSRLPLRSQVPLPRGPGADAPLKAGSRRVLYRPEYPPPIVAGAAGINTDQQADSPFTAPSVDGLFFHVCEQPYSGERNNNSEGRLAIISCEPGRKAAESLCFDGGGPPTCATAPLHRVRLARSA